MTFRRGFLRDLLLIATLLLGACAVTEPPGARDVAEVAAGAKTIVMFRVATTLEGKPHEPFAALLADDNVGVALGTFETGGRIRQHDDVRFFSEDTRERGWAYIVTEPGIVYLAFLPPRRTNVIRYAAMFEGTARWRVDAPPDADVVYAGTLDIAGRPGWSLFGSYLKGFKAMAISDDRGEAERIAARFVSNLDGFAVALMQRHQGPIILTSPKAH
jgi:hypothetical protein